MIYSRKYDMGKKKASNEVKPVAKPVQEVKPVKTVAKPAESKKTVKKTTKK